MSLPTGYILQQRYRIVKLIGQGGFGAVYRAWDLSLKQPVALKENLDTSQQGQRQFEREANMMAGLRHPNLARVTDHFLVDGQGQYLVMDFIEGTDLDELSQGRAQPFSETEIEPWLRQVGDALTYLHTRQPPIIHRDLKPQNIIITPSGEAMLVDFGISKLYDPHLKTTIGARAVTPGYSPPEQYGGGRTDARSDVYALGATVYNLLTGQDPPESVEIIYGSVALVPPRRINSYISPTAEQAILQAMETAGQRRFQSVADFVRAFCTPPLIQSQPVTPVVHHVSRSSGRTGTAVKPPPPVRKPPVRPQPSRWIAPVAVTATVALMVPLIFLLLWPPLGDKFDINTTNAAVEAQNLQVTQTVSAWMTEAAVTPILTSNIFEVAAGKPATASSFYGRSGYSFSPNAVVDRQTNELACTIGVERGNSYWLLADHQTGWIQIDLQQNYSVVKLRWLNTHNGNCADRATLQFRIALSDKADFLGEEQIVHAGSMLFSLSPEYQETILSRAVVARYIRFYVDGYYNWGGGLNEIEVYAESLQP